MPDKITWKKQYPAEFANARNDQYQYSTNWQCILIQKRGARSRKVFGGAATPTASILGKRRHIPIMDSRVT